MKITKELLLALLLMLGLVAFTACESDDDSDAYEENGVAEEEDEIEEEDEEEEDEEEEDEDDKTIEEQLMGIWLEELAASYNVFEFRADGTGLTGTVAGARGFLDDIEWEINDDVLYVARGAGLWNYDVTIENDVMTLTDLSADSSVEYIRNDDFDLSDFEDDDPEDDDPEEEENDTGDFDDPDEYNYLFGYWDADYIDDRSYYFGEDGTGYRMDSGNREDFTWEIDSSCGGPMNACVTMDLPLGVSEWEFSLSRYDDTVFYPTDAPDTVGHHLTRRDSWWDR